jgi:integrase
MIAREWMVKFSKEWSIVHASTINERLERDVFPYLGAKPVTTLKAPELLAVLRRVESRGALDTYQGSFVVKCTMKLLPMLFVRPRELRHMEWTELDLEASQWNIPAEKMKMKQAHIVPRSPQALNVLNELRPLTYHIKYVFPCQRTQLRCMSDNSINAALRRMGFEKSEVTAHGFRTTARTMLHEILLFSPDAIEVQLAHAVPDSV